MSNKNNELNEIFTTLESLQESKYSDIPEGFAMKFWEIAWEIKDMQERILQINRFQDLLHKIYTNK